MKRVGTLEVNEDMPFTRREWVFERCGWAFLLLLIFAASAGVFGSGPLSRAEAETADGLIEARYNRTIRQESAVFLEVQFLGDEAVREFSISEGLMKQWDIESITPEPEAVISEANRTTFRFHGTGPGQVTIKYQSSSAGAIKGFIEASPEQRIALKQFSFP